MTVEESAKKIIEKYLKSVNSAGYDFSKIIKKDYNFESTISGNGEKIKLQVYFGKKGVKTVLQGNADSDLYFQISKLTKDEIGIEFPKDKFDEPDEYLGSDESGKGDIFGPLVTAAVFVNRETSKKLYSIGVRDSKDISDYQINNLAKKIVKIVDNKYEVFLITPEKYNGLYPKFGNLNKLLNWMHSKTVENLLKKVDCNNLIVDKFSKEKLTLNKIDFNKSLNIQYTPKAERFTGVAAASIIARAKFNEWFIEQEVKGYDLLKGASKEAEGKAFKLYKSLGDKGLIEFTKMHFKSIKRIK